MLKIGSLIFKQNLFLAPMAGYTNPAFRKLMAQNGASLTTTEMVSVLALLHQNKKTEQLLLTSKHEKIKSVQLFGYNPDDFYKCASLKILDDFDIIDVNMGCPVKKVFSIGQGCALMQDVKRAADIVRALKAKNKIVTVKTRLGINSKLQIFDFATQLQQAGVDFMAIHCRTAQQMYTGQPDFLTFSQLKKTLTIPLAINGDIKDKESFLRAQQTQADAFMIGRGALLNPFIFLDLQNKPASLTKKQIILRLIEYMEQCFGNTRGAIELRKFFPFLLKQDASRELRHSLNFINDCNQLKTQIATIFNS